MSPLGEFSREVVYPRPRVSGDEPHVHDGDGYYCDQAPRERG